MTYPDPPVLLMQPGQFSCPRCGSGPGTVAQLVSAGSGLAPAERVLQPVRTSVHFHRRHPVDDPHRRCQRPGRHRTDGGRRDGVQHRGRVRRGRLQQRRRRRRAGHGIGGWHQHVHPDRQHAAAAEPHGRGDRADRHAGAARPDDLTGHAVAAALALAPGPARGAGRAAGRGGAAGGRAGGAEGRVASGPLRSVIAGKLPGTTTRTLVIVRFQPPRHV